jgi:hypothetical protein
MSITSEIRLRVRKEGDVVLNQLSAKLNDVAQRSTLTSAKFKDLSATLKQTDSQIRTKSINGLNDYARAWRELANSVDITSREFKEATREAQRFEQAAAKAQGRRGGGRAMAAAKGVGAVAASGIFGGPEGAIGALVGLPFGAAGAAVGGGIGAQVGMARQALGGTATYAAEISRQRQALQLVTKMLVNILVRFRLLIAPAVNLQSRKKLLLVNLHNSPLPLKVQVAMYVMLRKHLLVLHQVFAALVAALSSLILR